MRDTCAIRSNIAGYLFGFKEVLDRERSLGHADFLVKLTPVGGVVLALELELAVRPVVEVLIDLLLMHERDNVFLLRHVRLRSVNLRARTYRSVSGAYRLVSGVYHRSIMSVSYVMDT